MVIIINKEERTITIPKEDLSIMLRYLVEELKKDDSPTKKHLMADKKLGLCWLIDSSLNEILHSNWAVTNCGCYVAWRQLTIGNWLKEHFRTWVHFSGDCNFPIHVKDSKHTAQEQYEFLNKWEGKQLEARLDLLEHIAKSTDDLLFHVIFSKQEQPV